MKRCAMVLFALFGFASLGGCATQLSPLHDDSEGAYIFVTDDEDAIFDVAYDAMAAGEPRLAVTPVSGPIRGFTMRKQSFLDHWISTLLVHPAKGVTATGEILTGYYPEVIGDGTLGIRGPNMDERIYEAAQRGFARVGNRRSVIQLDEGIYSGGSGADSGIASSQREKNSDSASRGQSTSSRSTAQRLLELDSLLEKGLISEDEYEKARKAILEDL